MKQALLTALVLLFGTLLFAAAPTASNAEGPEIYVGDLFGRTVDNHWGTADSGGTYQIANNPSDFSVRDSVGWITLPSKNRRVSLDVSARDINSSVRVRINKRPTGGFQTLLMYVRKAGTNSYVGRLRLAPNGQVFVNAGKQVSGKISYFGRDVKVSGVSYNPDHYVFLKMQVTGANPTTIRVRSWLLGQTEPTTWNSEVTDSTAELQQGGGVGLRVAAKKNVTNLPFVFGFDDLKVTASVASTPPPPNSDSGSIYWGALVDGAAPSPGNLAANGLFSVFEQAAGKKMSILHWGQPWKMNGAYLPFQTSYFTAVRNRGSIPLVDWGSFHLGDGVNQPDFQLRDIINGEHDGYITQWARDAKRWGHPFFLRFDWEMNGDWQFPWSEKLNGNQPGDYVKMWRHVHDIFEREGTQNVTWVWCPNITSDQTTPLNSLYPGDAYVDWTCLDGYNKDKTWLEFNQVFGADGINWLHDSYKEITTLAPNKPLMIGETASLEAGDGGAKKAQWIKAALDKHLPTRFPKIKAVVFFDWDDRNPLYSFPITSSPAARQAFAKGISAGYFAANNFSNLSISPIPPIQ